MLVAKATVVAATAVIFGQVLCFGLFLAVQATLARIHHDLGIHHPGVVRAIVGAGVYLAVATLVDVTGLVIYFSVGLVVLRGTLL